MQFEEALAKVNEWGLVFGLTARAYNGSPQDAADHIIILEAEPTEDGKNVRAPILVREELTDELLRDHMNTAIGSMLACYRDELNQAFRTNDRKNH